MDYCPMTWPGQAASITPSAGLRADGKEAQVRGFRQGWATQELLLRLVCFGVERGEHVTACRTRT